MTAGVVVVESKTESTALIKSEENSIETALMLSLGLLLGSVAIPILSDEDAIVRWPNARGVLAWYSKILKPGMGDSCCGGIQNLTEQIQAWYPSTRPTHLDTITHSIMIGASESDDRKAGYFDLISRQVQEVCHGLKKVEGLSAGFNAVGFSQGCTLALI